MESYLRNFQLGSRETKIQYPRSFNEEESFCRGEPEHQEERLVRTAPQGIQWRTRIMKRFTFLFAITALLLAAQTGSTAQQDYRIIVHPEHKIESVSKGKLSQLLLKKVSRWEDGTPVAPVDLESKSPVREAVSRAVHGRSVSSIKSYWQRQIFSGREVPPPEMSSESQVIDYVSRTPGSIGYVSANANLTNVKELNVSN